MAQFVTEKPVRETELLDKQALTEESEGEKLTKEKMLSLGAVIFALALASLAKKMPEEHEEETKKNPDIKSDLTELRKESPSRVGIDIIPAEEGDIDFNEERFNELAKEKGHKIAFFNQQIFERYATALEFGQEYKTQVNVENYDGSVRNIKNNCVGFLMSVLAGLPFKISDSAKSNVGRYLSEYHWGGRDGLKDFIPDIAGDDKSKYYSIERLDPDNLDEQIGRHLAVGEYAIAAFWNHVLLIYKDINGEIKMVHSGANVNTATAEAKGYSRVNETTVSAYAKRMQKNGQPLNFAFIPISNILELAENNNDRDVENYYYDNMQYVA